MLKNNAKYDSYFDHIWSKISGLDSASTEYRSYVLPEVVVCSCWKKMQIMHYYTHFTVYCRWLSLQLCLKIDSISFTPHRYHVQSAYSINCVWVMNNPVRAHATSTFCPRDFRWTGTKGQGYKYKHLHWNKHICFGSTCVFPLREQLAEMPHLLQRRHEVMREWSLSNIPQKMLFFTLCRPMPGGKKMAINLISKVNSVRSIVMMHSNRSTAWSQHTVSVSYLSTVSQLLKCMNDTVCLTYILTFLKSLFHENIHIFNLNAATFHCTPLIYSIKDFLKLTFT